MLLVLSLLLLQGAVPEGAEQLLQAERAFAAGEFQQVLPALDAALASSLDAAGQRRAWELRAMTHAAFDDAAAAVYAYRHVFGLDPDFLPPPGTSPKLAGLIADAQRQGPLVRGVPVPRREVPSAALAPGAPPTRRDAAPSPPLWKRGWFWGVVGVTLGVAAAGTWYAGRPAPLPEGNLGRGSLR